MAWKYNTGPKLFRYPLKIFAEKTDYLQIDMQEYVPVGRKGQATYRKEIGYTNANTGEVHIEREETVTRDIVSMARSPHDRFRKNSNKKALGTVLLPIPSDIKDGNAVSFADDKLNSVASAAVGGSAAIMEGAGEEIRKGNWSGALTAATNSFQNAIGESGMSLDAAQDLATKWLSAQAVSIFGGNVTVQQLLARESGQIFNPNMELLFNGPTLRAFKFSFKMTPRNQEESYQVKEIIRMFKKGMSPKTGARNLYLKSPNVFELRYRQGAREHSFLHKFKQCFLQDISVNYTGEGTYATYEDGTPISMIMDLTFKELEPIYDIDYDSEDAGQGVGY